MASKWTRSGQQTYVWEESRKVQKIGSAISLPASQTHAHAHSADGHDQASGTQDIGAALPMPWCMRALPTPWCMRANNANASHGPLGDTACVEWMRDRHAQLYFAQHVSAPLWEEVPLRSVSCDSVSSHAARGLYVAKDYTCKRETLTRETETDRERERGRGIFLSQTPKKDDRE